MRSVWTLAALAASLLVGVAISQQTDAGAQSKLSVTYEAYTGKDLATEEAKEKLKGTPLAVKDIFDEDVKRFPSGLAKAFPPRKYRAFRTQAVRGSEMLCVVPRSDKEAIATLDAVTPQSKVFIYGRIRGRVGLSYVVQVDKIRRTWDPEPESKGIEITISQPNGRGEHSYSLAEPGKTYLIRSPYNAKPLWVSFKRK